MREFYSFDRADLVIAPRSAVNVKVHLEVAYKDDDEWAKDDKEDYGPDGVRIMGELQIEVPFNNTIVKKNAVGVLTVRLEEDASRFNVVFVEMIGSVSVIPNKLKHHFWLFYGVGRPQIDSLELFPDHYRRQPLRVYTVRNFNGRWPLAVTAVAVAEDRKEARRLLDAELDKAGVLKGQNKDYDLDELDITTPQALVLHDGSM